MKSNFVGIAILCLLFSLACSCELDSSSRKDEPLQVNDLLMQVDEILESTEIDTITKTKSLISVEGKIQNLPIQKDQLELLDAVALAHLSLSDTSNFFRVNKELTSYQDNPDTAKGTVWYYYNLKNFYLSEGQLTKAYQTLQDGFEEIQKLDLAQKDLIYRPRILARIASIEEKARLFDKSVATLVRCLKILDEGNFEKDKKRDLYLKIYRQLGIAHAGMKDYDKALEYYKTAYDYSRELDNVHDRNAAFYLYTSNTANALFNKKDFESAFENYLILSDKFNDLPSDRDRVNCLVGKASSGYFAGILTFEDAEEIFISALKLAQSKFSMLNPWVQYSWAKVLFDEGKKDEAIKKMIEAYQLAQQNENTDRELNALEFLAVNGQNLPGNYSESYVHLIHKTQKNERLLQGKFSEIQYGVEKSEKELAKQSQAKQIWLGTSLALLFLGFGGFIIISQRSKNKELIWEKQQQVANEEIYNLMLGQRAKLEEGKKIAEKSISEEIHDGILGEMLGIRLILSGLNESSDEAAIQKRQELIEQLQGLEEELRSISHQLNASAYNKVNEFALALEELLDTNCKPVELQYSYNYTPEFNWDQLPGEVKIQLYRMVQSGLKNTIKHAQATEVEVKMAADKHQISLEIRDNGIGFDPGEERKGIGLKNLRSRIQKINGNLEIRSALGKGTSLHIRIPHKYLFAETNSSTTQTA